MATCVESNAMDTSENCTKNTLLNVAEVTKSFMAAMKFRRKTVGQESDESEKPPQRRFQSVSGASDISSEGNHKTPLRRRSTFKGLAKGFTQLLRLRRSTIGSLKLKEPQTPKIIYENTYKTGPDTGKHFNINTINTAVYEAMEQELHDKEYNYMTAGDLACNLSVFLKNKVKEMNIPRYRIICQVTIAQVADQGMEAASRYLWDDKRDNYTCVTYRNNSLIAIAMIHGVYFE